MARPATSKDEAAAVPVGTACTITALEPDVFAAGQRHQTAPATYPEGWFTEKQIAEMQADARLKVSRK